MSTVNPDEMSEDDRRRELDHLEWSSLIGFTMCTRRVNKRRAERRTYLDELAAAEDPKERTALQARIALGSRLIELAEKDCETWAEIHVAASVGSLRECEVWRVSLTSEGQRAYSGYRDRLAEDFDGTIQQTEALVEEVRETQSREADR